MYLLVLIGVTECLCNMLEIGQRVICINSSKLSHTIGELEADMPNWIKKNEKYIIRGFNENNGIVLGILLEEVVNPIRYFRLIGKSQEGSFRVDRFEKIIEDEVSIEKEEYCLQE